MIARVFEEASTPVVEDQISPLPIEKAGNLFRNDITRREKRYFLGRFLVLCRKGELGPLFLSKPSTRAIAKTCERESE